MTKKYFGLVIAFQDDDEDPRYSVPQIAVVDAPVSEGRILIDPYRVDQHGIDLDDSGFPESASLEAWHRKHNPHLFAE